MEIIFEEPFVLNMNAAMFQAAAKLYLMRSILLTALIVETTQSTSAAWLKLNKSGFDLMNHFSVNIVIKSLQDTAKKIENLCARLP